MSFYTSIKKPNLVEPKLINYYKDKIIQKNLKKKVELANNEKIQNEKNMQIILQSETWYTKLCNICLNFFKENYGFVILTFLITVLLWIRYIEVLRRKDKIKKLQEQIESEISSDS